MSNLDWALEYAGRGWKVFPVFYILKNGGCSCGKANCKRAGKHPMTKNGWHDATNDLDQIRVWWTANRHANIGLATGNGGLIVMDVDSSPKLDKEGKEI